MEKLFISRQSWHSNLDALVMLLLFLNCILTWRVNSSVSRQRKALNTRNESAKCNRCYLSYYTVNQSFHFVSYICFLTDNKMIFPRKNSSVLIVVDHSRRKRYL